MGKIPIANPISHALSVGATWCNHIGEVVIPTIIPPNIAKTVGPMLVCIHARIGSTKAYRQRTTKKTAKIMVNIWYSLLILLSHPLPTYFLHILRFSQILPNLQFTIIKFRVALLP